MVAQPNPPRETWSSFEACFGRLDEKNNNAAAVAFHKLQDIVAKSKQPVLDNLVSHLIDALASPQPRQRKRAAFALAVLDDKAKPAIPALLVTLEDHDSNVRWSAATALNQIGWNSQPPAALLAGLSAAGVADRMLSLMALGGLEKPSEKVIAGVARRLVDSDGTVCALAADALICFAKNPQAVSQPVAAAFANETIQSRLSAAQTVWEVWPGSPRAAALSLLLLDITGWGRLFLASHNEEEPPTVLRSVLLEAAGDPNITPEVAELIAQMLVRF